MPHCGRLRADSAAGQRLSLNVPADKTACASAAPCELRRRESSPSHRLARAYMLGGKRGRNGMAAKPPETFKPVRDRRKAAPVKRVAISAESREAYENTIRERDRREREHSQFLPDERKGKR